MSSRKLRKFPLFIVSAGVILACTPPVTPGADLGTTGTTTPDEISPTEEDPTTTSAGGSTSTTGTTGEPGTTSSSSSGPGESTGAVGTCGDGVLDEGEECDEGGENDDEGECTRDCRAAVCGDGLVWAGVEACDDAADNGNHYAGCGADCTRNPYCGDSVLDVQYEDCDYGENNGNGEGDDIYGPCSDVCRWDGRVVFLSSLLYTGDLRDGELEGLAGADSLCQTRAWAAGMQGWQKFRAWLSDGKTGALKRFVDIPVRPLLLPNGELVAHSLSDLVLNGPVEGLRTDEFGAPLPSSLVWTNTGISGALASAVDHCDSWTSASAGPTALVGRSHVSHDPEDAWQLWKSEKRWTSLANLDCSELARLYCFEQ